MTNDSDDDEQYLTMGDPGHMGEDEPEVRPLCRRCVAEPPDGDDGLCMPCRAWEASR